MKTGKHYFSLLTEEEQRKFKQACEETSYTRPFNLVMKTSFKSFHDFIDAIKYWEDTKEGIEYWRKIANSNRTEKPTEKPKTTNISYFEDEKPLTTFRLIFVYSIITFVALSLLMIAYKAGYDNGRLKGFNQGVDFGTIEIQNLMGWDAPAAETVEQYEQMIKEQRDESTK